MIRRIRFLSAILLIAALPGVAQAQPQITSASSTQNAARSGVYYAGGIVLANSSAGAANASAINAQMAEIGANGGGTLYLPCGMIYLSSPIDNHYARVLVRGCGRDSNHNVPGSYGTTLRATAPITVLRHRTLAGGRTMPVVTGGGFTDMSVYGNGIATRLLEVISTRYGAYNLYLDGSVGKEAAYFGSLTEGPEMGDNGSTQHAVVNLVIRQIDGEAAQSAAGVVFDGSPNGNFSMNDFVSLEIIHTNGDAIICKNADNNVIKAQIYRTSGGTGRAFYGYGENNRTGSVGCVANNFDHLTVSGAVSGGAIYMRGTNDGDTAGVKSHIAYLDVANGSPLPMAGSGSSWSYFDNLHNMLGGTAATRTLITEDAANASSALGNICTTCSLDVQNNHEDHIRLRNSSASTAWNLTLSDQNLRFYQTAGSGGRVLMGQVRLSPVAFRTLPQCAPSLEGTLAAIVDGNSTTFNARLSGGGTHHVMAYCNGTNWTVH